jgi:hypothetical protein
MSDADFGSIGEDAVDALYDTGFATGALLSGDLETAADRYLDASSSALDALTDGGFSHLVDRFEADTGIDTREVLEDGLEYVGGAVGDAAYDAVEYAGEVYDDAAGFAGEVYDSVSEAGGEVYDALGDGYDALAEVF